MFLVERQERIVQYINNHQKANTDQLAKEFDVSEVTIRRDIDALANKGLLVKTHGGAVSISNSLLSYEIPHSMKSEINAAAKKKIGAAGAGFIKDGDIIILDAGSTTLEVAKAITAKNVTVLTNDIQIALELSHKKDITVIVSGGKLLGSVYSLSGNQTIEFFSKTHVNRTILGCDALDASFGVSNRTMEESSVKAAMIAAADEVIMVTDSSKFNKKVFQYVCSLKDIDKIITNQLDDITAAALSSNNVEIILA